MFASIHKGRLDTGDGHKTYYRKCLLIGDSVVMDYNNTIVGIAKLYEESEDTLDYDIVVARDCELGADAIARVIKTTIRKANNYSPNPTDKRRKYYVEKVDGEKLNVKAQIMFTNI